MYFYNCLFRNQPAKEFKSPYNHNTKKNFGGSSKKRSIESDLKDISTHVTNTHHSDSRHKAALLNGKTENSLRLPLDVGAKEESKRSQDVSLKTASNMHNTEELSEILRQNNLNSADVKRHLGSGHLTQATLESDNGVITLLKKVKEQEIIIERHKAMEQEYKNKIFEMEKKLKEESHRFELQKLENEREVSVLKNKLEKKNTDLTNQMENFIMNKLDLDEYGITSDDLRNSHSSRNNDKTRTKSHDPKKMTQNKPHPLVPVLDFQKIFDWREKANTDNVIMIRISESRVLGEDQITEEINEEDGVEKKNRKYYSKGVPYKESSGRINELFERKQMIINALNQAYTDDEESDDVNQEDNYETE
jgi:hypothetical protein